MDLRSAAERLADALRPGRSNEERNAELVQVVSSVADRIFAGIDKGLDGLQALQASKADKIARCWVTLATRGVKEIEDAGSLAPGLSHQEIYVKELHQALNEAQTGDEFLAGVDKLSSKWGSRVKYPLYAGGRKKQLTALKEGVQQNLAAEEKRVRERLEQTYTAEHERVFTEAKESINLTAVELRGLLISALDWQPEPGPVAELRWFLINGMNQCIFNRLDRKLGDDQGDYRDLLYFALERVMRSMYESFQALVTGSGASTADGKARVSRLIGLEIQFSRTAAAKFETKLGSQQLSGQLISSIRDALRSGADAINTEPKVFAEICAGLRGDYTFEKFTGHLRRVSGLDQHQREEVVAAVKTSIEPFRSMYYAKITFVRYMKGLKTFQDRLAAGSR